MAGLGYWGPNLLRVLCERTDVKLKWICDRTPFAWNVTPAGIQPGAPDLDEVLEDPEIDAVLLATPVLTHYSLGRRCLLAGKHAFVEKPLAPSTAEALELIDLALERGLVLSAAIPSCIPRRCGRSGS